MYLERNVDESARERRSRAEAAASLPADTVQMEPIC